MSKHPYPQHIKDAITEAVFHKSINEGVTIHDIADLALQALWDASRVDTMEQVERLPDHSFLIDEGGCCIAETPDDRAVPAYLPAHVIYWGDSDE